MTELETKHWLNRAFYAEKKAKALTMLVAQCRERAEGLSRCTEFNDKGRSDSTENDTENALMRLADMEQKADAQRAEVARVSAEIWEAIMKLHDSDLEAVLIHRYLLFHTIEQTAEIMGCDPRTVKRKTRKAIEKMSLNVPIDM